MTPIARHPWPLLCALGAAVLALHVMALLAFGAAGFDLDRASAAAVAMQVRSVTPAAAPPVAALSVAAPAPLAPPLPSKAPRRGAATPAPAVTDAPRQSDAETAQRDAFAAPPAEAVGAEVDVPVYPTRLPAAGRWRYRLLRGSATGDAELQWAPSDDARYALRLEGRVAGVTVLDWASQGQIDAAGVAPERFALRRRGRDRQAANFQRDIGRITFSGPTHESPLRPGAQDRLSWMLQLPAIVAAAPERFVAGASIVLFVAGARGDADVWSFVVQGSEPIGDRPALKLLREPRGPYDTRAEVWLDPAESYLPLRVLQTPSGGGAALDLQREPGTR